MRKVFRVELSSENGCTELTLPATPYALLDALDKVWLGEGEAPRWEILQSNAFPGVSLCLDEKGTLPELNALAQRLAQLDERELAIVEGLVLMEPKPQGEPIPLPRLIDLAYSTDCCHLVDGVVTDAQLGRFCAENGFVPETDGLTDRQFELLDLARIGRDFCQSEGGVFTRGGYVQRHDEVKQMYKTLDLTPKKPDYIILVESPDSGRTELPAPSGIPLTDEAVLCVDCAAPMLNGLSGRLDFLNYLSHRMTELELDGELPKYKAVLEATGCDDISRALTLADELDGYAFDPDLLEPDEVASRYLKGLLPKKELAALLPNVNLYRYGQKIMEQSGGKLTGYGYIKPTAGLVQGMDPQTDEVEMKLN